MRFASYRSRFRRVLGGNLEHKKDCLLMDSSQRIYSANMSLPSVTAARRNLGMTMMHCNGGELYNAVELRICRG